MRAAIITIGNEILKGKTINSNAAEIGRLLFFSGYEVWRGLVVPDRREDIGEAFKEMTEKSDVVVSTGGLGPTFDDITVESFASEFRLPLVLDREVYEQIKFNSSRRGLEMTKEREKMAYIPEGASVIKNTVGTAPGIFLKIKECKLFILPGVPAEMRSMLPYVKDAIRLNDSFYVEQSVILEGIFEATLAPFISELMKKYGDSIYIKTHPSLSPERGESHIEVEISAHSSEKKEAESLVKSVIEDVNGIARKLTGKSHPS
ncbi:MAG: molybdopterin-binding protein [Thermoplasmata archaeon]